MLHNTLVQQVNLGFGRDGGETDTENRRISLEQLHIYNVICNYPMTMCAHALYLRKVRTAAELLFVITCSV